MKRYIRSAFADDRPTQNIDELKSIITEALAAYGIEPTKCHVSEHGISDIIVKYQGREYKTAPESNIYWHYNITSLQSYESSKEFQAILGHVFLKLLSEDANLERAIQEEINDIVNSLNGEDGTFVECNYIGGHVYAFVPEKHSSLGGAHFYPLTWEYHAPDGLIEDTSKYKKIANGFGIDLTVFDAYDVLTSGVKSIDETIEEHAVDRFNRMVTIFNERRIQMDEDDRRYELAKKNYEQLKKYLEGALAQYDVKVRVERDIYSHDNIVIDYDVDGWKNSYSPKTFELKDLWNMDSATMKKIYTAIRKAINKAKHSDQYSRYQERKSRNQSFEEW